METLRLFITKCGEKSIYVTIDEAGLCFFCRLPDLNNTLKDKGITRYSVSWLSDELKARLIRNSLLNNS